MVVSKFCHYAHAMKLNARGNTLLPSCYSYLFITYKSDTLTTIMSGLKLTFNHMKFLC